MPVNSMKLPAWRSMELSFYGIAWTFSMGFHGKCPNPPWRYFPWRNFYGNLCPNPWTMEFTGKFSIEFQEFHGGVRVNFQLQLRRSYLHLN